MVEEGDKKEIWSRAREAGWKPSSASLQVRLGKQRERREARHKAPFTLRCTPFSRGPLSFSAWDPKEKYGVSTGCDLKKTHHALPKVTVAVGNKIYYKTIFVAPSDCLLHTPLSLTLSAWIGSRLIWARFQRKILSDLSLSVSCLLCLLSLSHPLHFAYSICWLLPWAMIPFTPGNSAPFIWERRRKRRKKKQHLLLSSCLPSTSLCGCYY